MTNEYEKFLENYTAMIHDPLVDIIQAYIGRKATTEDAKLVELQMSDGGNTCTVIYDKVCLGSLIITVGESTATVEFIPSKPKEQWN